MSFTVTFSNNSYLISFAAGKKISYSGYSAVVLDGSYVVIGSTFLDYRHCTNPLSASALDFFTNIQGLWTAPESTTEVSNFPVTQPVSGTVAVSSMPPISVTTGPTEIVSPLEPFGAVSTAQIVPLFQEYFVNNFLNPFRWASFALGAGASITTANSMVSITQGSASTGLVAVLGKKSIHYRPGIGTFVRFTVVFDTGIANCLQMAGLWNNNSGVGFGYNGVDFGLFYRNGGFPEIRVLTLTVGASGAGTVTLTLDGVSFGPIAVVAGSTTFTAHQLQSFNYSGWSCLHIGTTLHFRNLLDGPRSGVYSIASTVGVTGTFATEKAGITATTLWTPRASFNEDDVPWHNPQFGNIYEITYQWLGFGQMVYKIQNPTTGVIAPVHIIRYANTSSQLSMIQPNLPCTTAIMSTGTTTPKIMKIGCYSAGIFGSFVLPGRNLRSYSRNNFSYLTASGEMTMFSIRNRPSLNGYVNQSNLIFQNLNLSASGNNQVRFNLYLDATLGNNTAGNFDAWSYVDVANSLALIDVTSTTSSGGTLLLTSICGQSESKIIDLRQLNLECHRDDTFTITAFSANNSNLTVSLNWYDDF